VSKGLAPDAGAVRRLLKNPRFAGLTLADTVFNLGEAIFMVVWVVSFYNLTESGWALGLLMFTRFAPEVLLGPFAGAWADRVDRKRLLVFTDLARAALVASLLVWQRSPLTYYIVTLLLASGSVLYHPAQGAIIANVVAPGELLVANSILTTAANGARIVGALASGVAIATLGTSAAFLINAATFLVSGLAVWVAAPSIPPQRAAAGERRRVWPDIVDGWRFVRDDPVVLAVTLGAAAMWAGIAVSDAILIVFLEKSLALPGASLGYMRTVVGVGSIAGAFALPFLARRQPSAPRLLAVAVLATGLFFGALAASQALWQALFVYALGSAAATAVENISSTVQQRVPDRVRGRVMATGSALETLGYLFIVALTPALTDLVPVRLVLVLGGVILIAAAPVTLLLARRARRRAGGGGSNGQGHHGG